MWQLLIIEALLKFNCTISQYPNCQLKTLLVRFKMDRIDAMLFANQKIRQYNLSGWTFKFNKNKKRLGVCKYGPRTIELSVYHLGDSDEEIKDTILHEIAHAISGYAAKHGPIWQACCIVIGAKPERLKSSQSMKEAPAKYELVCPNCNAVKKMHRRPKKERACGKCCNQYNRGIYAERFKFKVLQCR